MALHAKGVLRQIAGLLLLLFAHAQSSPNRCPCVPAAECPGHYGTSPLDVLRYGNLLPCSQFGYFRCCPRGEVARGLGGFSRQGALPAGHGDDFHRQTFGINPLNHGQSGQPSSGETPVTPEVFDVSDAKKHPALSDFRDIRPNSSSNLTKTGKLSPPCGCYSCGTCGARHVPESSSSVLECRVGYETCCFPEDPWPDFVATEAAVVAPCAAPPACLRAYGSSPLDVTLFGALEPCYLHQVRCLDILLDEAGLLQVAMPARDDQLCRGGLSDNMLGDEAILPVKQIGQPDQINAVLGDASSLPGDLIGPHDEFLEFDFLKNGVPSFHEGIPENSEPQVLSASPLSLDFIPEVSKINAAPDSDPSNGQFNNNGVPLSIKNFEFDKTRSPSFERNPINGPLFTRIPEQLGLPDGDTLAESPKFDFHRKRIPQLNLKFPNFTFDKISTKPDVPEQPNLPSPSGTHKISSQPSTKPVPLGDIETTHSQQPTPDSLDSFGFLGTPESHEISLDSAPSDAGSSSFEIPLSLSLPEPNDPHVTRSKPLSVNDPGDELSDAPQHNTPIFTNFAYLPPIRRHISSADLKKTGSVTDQATSTTRFDDSIDIARGSVHQTASLTGIHVIPAPDLSSQAPLSVSNDQPDVIDSNTPKSPNENPISPDANVDGMYVLPAPNLALPIKNDIPAEDNAVFGVSGTLTPKSVASVENSLKNSPNSVTRDVTNPGDDHDLNSKDVCQTEDPSSSEKNRFVCIDKVLEEITAVSQLVLDVVDSDADGHISMQDISSIHRVRDGGPSKGFWVGYTTSLEELIRVIQGLDSADIRQLQSQVTNKLGKNLTLTLRHIYSQDQRSINQVSLPERLNFAIHNLLLASQALGLSANPALSQTLLASNQPISTSSSAFLVTSSGTSGTSAASFTTLSSTWHSRIAELLTALSRVEQMLEALAPPQRSLLGQTIWKVRPEASEGYSSDAGVGANFDASLGTTLTEGITTEPVGNSRTFQPERVTIQVIISDETLDIPIPCRPVAECQRRHGGDSRHTGILGTLPPCSELKVRCLDLIYAAYASKNKRPEIFLTISDEQVDPVIIENNESGPANPLLEDSVAADILKDHLAAFGQKLHPLEVANSVDISHQNESSVTSVSVEVFPSSEAQFGSESAAELSATELSTSDFIPVLRTSTDSASSSGNEDIHSEINNPDQADTFPDAIFSGRYLPPPLSIEIDATNNHAADAPEENAAVEAPEPGVSSFSGGGDAGVTIIVTETESLSDISGGDVTSETITVTSSGEDHVEAASVTVGNGDTEIPVLENAYIQFPPLSGSPFDHVINESTNPDNISNPEYGAPEVPFTSPGIHDPAPATLPVSNFVDSGNSNQEVMHHGESTHIHVEQNQISETPSPNLNILTHPPKVVNSIISNFHGNYPSRPGPAHFRPSVKYGPPPPRSKPLSKVPVPANIKTSLNARPLPRVPSRVPLRVPPRGVKIPISAVKRPFAHKTPHLVPSKVALKPPPPLRSPSVHLSRPLQHVKRPAAVKFAPSAARPAYPPSRPGSKYGAPPPAPRPVSIRRPSKVIHVLHSSARPYTLRSPSTSGHRLPPVSRPRPQHVQTSHTVRPLSGAAVRPGVRPGAHLPSYPAPLTSSHYSSVSNPGPVRVHRPVTEAASPPVASQQLTPPSVHRAVGHVGVAAAAHVVRPVSVKGAFRQHFGYRAARPGRHSYGGVGRPVPARTPVSVRPTYPRPTPGVGYGRRQIYQPNRGLPQFSGRPVRYRSKPGYPFFRPGYHYASSRRY